MIIACFGDSKSVSGIHCFKQDVQLLSYGIDNASQMQIVQEAFRIISSLCIKNPVGKLVCLIEQIDKVCLYNHKTDSVESVHNDSWNMMDKTFIKTIQSKYLPQELVDHEMNMQLLAVQRYCNNLNIEFHTYTSDTLVETLNSVCK